MPAHKTRIEPAPPLKAGDDRPAVTDASAAALTAAVRRLQAVQLVTPGSKVRFAPTPLEGSYLIHLDPHVDRRGMFARAFCAREFAAHGLETNYVQSNISHNVTAGILRGLHFQRAPHAEVKLVRCIKGAIYDVIVDMRETSDTYLGWFGAELSEDNGLMMYVPQGFAHGYQALTDNATAFYMVSAFYAPAAEGGVRYNDPKLAIPWPRAVTDVSDKDVAWPLLPG
jgi:dTDP-4-dehydrorhamnose 3,5-epimerase